MERYYILKKDLIDNIFEDKVINKEINYIQFLKYIFKL